jgi:restriction system protein
VICECKKHTNPIKRDTIQSLLDRKESLGAHKAFLFATARFQDGAEKYAAIHGIALIEIVNGAIAYIQNSACDRPPMIPDDADPYVGLFHGDMSGGLIYPMLIDTSHTYEIKRFLKFEA